MDSSIGCDVSKAKLDFAVIGPGQKAIGSFVVSNDEKGHAEAIKKLASHKESLVIMESTSHYHVEIAFAFREAGMRVVVLNPLTVRKYVVSGIRKTKTDKADAKLLAKIGFLEHDLKFFNETRENIERKMLSQLIKKLQKDHQAHAQRLHQLEDQMKEGNVTLGIMIDSINELLESCSMQIERLQNKLIQLVGPEAELIASIPGVGLASAACIVAELGDVGRFKGRNQVAAFAGLDPSIRESGSSVHGRSRITKRGSRELRGVLGRVAWGAMMHNPVFKKYYQDKAKEGKHYFAILVAMSRKMLLIIYSMLKSKTPYDLSKHQAACT